MQISQGQRIPLSNLIQGQSLSLAILINSPIQSTSPVSAWMLPGSFRTIAT